MRQRDVNKLVGGQTIGEYGDAFDDGMEADEGRTILPLTEDYEFAQFRFNDGADLLWLEGGRTKISVGDPPGTFLYYLAKARPQKIDGWDFQDYVALDTEGILILRLNSDDRAVKDYGGDARLIAGGPDNYGSFDYWFLVQQKLSQNRELFIPAPSDNRCPDCDATLEQRSMLDGIEEWCPVCNLRPYLIDINGEWIQKEGTIIGDFQKERTNALSEMFDNEGVDGIYPTSRLYMRLDMALIRALKRQRQEIQGE